MKSLSINILVLFATLATMGCALGCSQGDQVSGSSAGSGGHDAGSGCLWGGNGGGLTFPVCPADNTSEFMGTVDGKPYDTKDSGHITATSPPVAPPYQLSMALSGTGSLDIEWGDPYLRGQWTKISGGGYLRLPEDGVKLRAVFVDSEILRSCDEYAFLYILHVTGGDLTGCSR
jgi:hypothetical protein